MGKCLQNLFLNSIINRFSVVHPILLKKYSLYYYFGINEQSSWFVRKAIWIKGAKKVGSIKPKCDTFLLLKSNNPNMSDIFFCHCDIFKPSLCFFFISAAKQVMSTILLDLQSKNSNKYQTNENLIQRFEQSDLSYNDFYWNYMNRNWPVILTSVSNDWECRRRWTTQTTTKNNETTEINFKYLKDRIGDCKVPVANCSKEYFNSHEKCEMKFFDYLDQWQKSAAESDENLYLKDWHLKAQMPDYDFYKVPKYFASDWLNEYLIDRQLDDYRFVYMGPMDSWTPFHADVFGSYSWSTNIAGRKQWLLLPPQEEQKLTDSLGNLPFRITEQQLTENNVKFFTIIQTENESIFIPSGWYHQVWNLSDTISINHNWFNACNVPTIWRNLAINMQRVIREIEDCRQMDNFEEHCQTMLRASFGINYWDFLSILQHIISKRVQCINNNNIDNILFKTFTLNDFHVRYDLAIIADVLEAIATDDVVKTQRELCDKCMELAEQTKGFKFD